MPGPSRRRTGRRAAAALAAVAAALLTAASAAPTTTVPEDGASAAALRALVSAPAHEARHALPDDFVEQAGYRPRVVDGALVRPDGDCSSPVPLPERFEPVCRQHDLGYDLLRHAERAGAPLGPWARRDLDDLMADRMRQSCSTGRPERTCLLAQRVASTAVRANSVRQHHGSPTESPAGLAAGAAGVVAIGSLLLPRPRRVRP